MDKISELKNALDTAQAAYAAKQEELKAAGLKSQDRYEVLKPLKAVVAAANSAYVKAGNAVVAKKLDKIIAAGAPRRRAVKLANSAWKRAKAGK